MDGPLRRSITTAPVRRSVSEIQSSPVVDNTDWAQAELSSYFKQHPEKLSFQLDRIMDKLRASEGDMQRFIVELDVMIDELNADIDKERCGVAGRDRLMRDYADVTNEFLHFFLDGIMEAMENEQAAEASATKRGSAGSSRGGGGGGATFPGSILPAPAARSGALVTKNITGMRPRSSGSSGSSKERFTNVAKRLPA
ncbi:hypothetical protein VOLCADRAFT_103959 [Volvox carteri f. nagariensis]|uniref:Uncharacterized protein n=1 Tax=Volvox carteri f. nagariensis TaxID=3068 RepID=D8TQB8_VOLCA|nr:uncharacterized protein VOLCADRAFT_103959 [Volvox carteri f. nagariensis]EFJ50507.1 hypothetical protein VOLCADRAFT_103959 [Volvox carteri f. nagariensis]|eukprot:XP_002948632.1 hypothetical protein VOLCADRAFT_103959 [Volvox carteri f. nagariensis]